MSNCSSRVPLEVVSSRTLAVIVCFRKIWQIHNVFRRNVDTKKKHFAIPAYRFFVKSAYFQFYISNNSISKTRAKIRPFSMGFTVFTKLTSALSNFQEIKELKNKTITTTKHFQESKKWKKKYVRKKKNIFHSKKHI